MILSRSIMLTVPAHRVHERLRVVAHLLRFKVIDHHLLIAVGKSARHGVEQTLAVLGVDFKLVDHKFYRVVAVTVNTHTSG